MNEPADSPEKPPWTVRRVLLWAVAGLVGVTLWNVALVPMLTVVGGRSRTPHRTLEAQNDVKQLALAVTNSHAAHGAFPPHGDEVDPGAPPVAWMTAILPFMDERRLYRSVDFTKPFDAPENAEAFSTVVRSYTSPYADESPRPDGLAPAHYAGNAELFVPNLTLNDVDRADGLTQTLMLAEVNAASGAPPAWGDPTNLRSAAAPLNGPTGFGANGPGGSIIVAFADGRATLISPDIDPTLLKALGTPNGGETISDD